MHYIENVILASRSRASVPSDILSGCLNPMEPRMSSVISAKLMLPFLSLEFGGDLSNGPA